MRHARQVLEGNDGVAALVGGPSASLSLENPELRAPN
jgi:hypothetical protein